MRIDLRFRICPPFFGLRGLRSESPACNNGDTYRSDVAFFKGNPHRNTMIRPAYFNEFDCEFESVGEWLKLPQLHVVVTQISVGAHLIVPVYRGKPFFGEVTTNAEVAMIVEEMKARGGIDKAEFDRFEQMHNARVNLPRSKKNEVVH